ALVLLDLRLPRMSGLDVLKQIKQTFPEVMVIVMTAYATVEQAVEAMKEGAWDFLTKPLTPGHLELVVQKAFERQALERIQHLLQADLEGKAQPILSASPVLQQAIERARGAEHGDCAAAGGERHRQGGLRPGHPCLEPTVAAALCGGQLCR